jgi:hypothetical protein
MSNYTKTTNFSTKDALPSGNPAKIVKGTEIDTEFNNIATAVATKSNSASPTFTGTLTAPVVTASTSLNIAGDGATVTGIKDEDDMASNSATKLATQQSIKAYVDSQVTAQDLDVTDGTTSISIDLDSEALSLLGGTGIDSTASGNSVTMAIDSTVATLTGTQTLSNKTLATPVISGNLTTDGTVDGRDVAADGAKLDGIEAGADVTDTANVTAAGALMDSELTNITAVKALDQGVATTDSPTFAAATVTGEITANGGIALGDNDKATFGASDDLQIYHSGAHSFISDAGTGNLYLSAADSFIVRTEGVAVSATFTPTAGVDLNYAGAPKLATTATGIDVTGTASADQLNSNNGKLFLDDNGTHNGVINAPASLYVNFDSDNTSASEKILFGYDRDGTSGGTSVMEINSTGIDVTGTATMDGLTVQQPSGANILLESTTTGATAGDIFGEIEFKTNDSSSAGVKGKIDSYSEGGVGNGALRLFTGDTTGLYQRMNIASNGDISFYEDTGTTAKFFWDASAESLGIGTSTPSAPLVVNATNASEGIRVQRDGVPSQYLSINEFTGGEHRIYGYGNKPLDIGSTEAVDIRLRTNSDIRMTIDSSGNVGIGASSPSSLLHASGVGATFTLQDTRGTGNTHTLRSSGTNGESLQLDSAQDFYLNADTQIFRSASEVERMRIDSSGNVGIGVTPNASARLHIGKSGGSPELWLERTDGYLPTKLIGNTLGNGQGFKINVAGTDSLAIDSSGNVGINTSSPDGILDIEGNFETSKALVLTNTKGTGKVSYVRSHGGNGETLALYHDGALRQTWDSNGSATFESGGTERMRIDSSGNVLVGKSATGFGTAGIELRSNGELWATTGVTNSASFNRTGSYGPIVTFNSANNPVGSIGVEGSRPYFANDDTGGFSISSAGYIIPATSTGAISDATKDLGISGARFKDLYLSGSVVAGTGATNAATLNAYSKTVSTNLPSALRVIENTGASSYWDIGSTGGASNNLNFYANANTTPKMTLSGAGNLLVGTTVTGPGAQSGVAIAGGATSSDVYIRHANGTASGAVYAAFIYNTSQVGSITQNGTSQVLYNISSDQRLKENIVDADDAGSKIDAIQVRQYDWKADGAHQDYGMIAQELQAVVPEAVSGDADSEEMMGVDYSKLVPMLIKEIQSLRNRVAQLEG